MLDRFLGPAGRDHIAEHPVWQQRLQNACRRMDRIHGAVDIPRSYEYQNKPDDINCSSTGYGRSHCTHGFQEYPSHRHDGDIISDYGCRHIRAMLCSIEGIHEDD